MPSDLLWALVNPFAQVPADWPVGLWGAFLIFLMPIGAGAPLAVVMARDAIPPVIAPLVPGWLIPVLTPLIIAGMYLVSDLIIAVTYEPMFALLAWLARIVPVFGRIRDVLAISTGRVGMRAAGVRGPASLILVSLLTRVPFGRG